MISALNDNGLGWENVQPRIRVLLTVTDAMTHNEGDLRANITRWNERLGTDAMEGGDKWLMAFGDCKVGSTMWNRLKELRSLYEAGVLTPVQEVEFSSLVATCGPFFNPDDIVTHPGDQSEADVNDCKHWEYPNVGQVIHEITKNQNTIPVVLAVAPNVGMAYLNSQFDCGVMTSEAECLRAYYAHTLGDSINGGYVALDTELDIPAGIEHQLRTLQALYDSSPYCQPETTVCPEFEGTEPCLENDEVILRYHGGRNRLRIQELVPALQSLVASGY